MKNHDARFCFTWGEWEYYETHDGQKRKRTFSEAKGWASQPISDEEYQAASDAYFRYYGYR